MIVGIAIGLRELRGLGHAWSWVLGCLLLLGFGGVTFVTAPWRGVDPVHSGWFVVGVAVVTVIVVSAAVAMHVRGHRRPARWVAWLALSLAGYAAVAGLASLTASPWVVAWEGAWFIIPITLTSICCLVTVEELHENPRYSAVGRLVPTALAVCGLVLGFGSVDYQEVYPGVSPPLAGTVLGEPAVAAVFPVVTVAWMLSVTLAPILAFRSAAHSAGLVRGRLTIVAIAAATPLLTLATCVLLWVAYAAGLLSDQFASSVLTVAFLVPPAIVAPGLTVACSARDDGVTGSLGRAARWVLRGLWVTITAQLAALVAALLAVGTGTPSALAASTIAVVLGVVFVSGYGAVAVRVDRFMASSATDAPGEPESTTDASMAAPLSGTLSPREREVLSLIAEGMSNAAIAAELVLSERTIDSHVSSIFDKLGLGREAGTNRRVQAAATWIRADLESRGRVG